MFYFRPLFIKENGNSIFASIFVCCCSDVRNNAPVIVDFHLSLFEIITKNYGIQLILIFIIGHNFNTHHLR